MYFFTIILRNLFRRPERSLLTVLGMAVSVCALVTLRGVAHNFQSAFEKNFAQRGVDIVVVEDGKTDQLSSDLDENLDELFRQIPGVKDVHKGLNELIDVQKQNTSVPVMMTGWPAGAPQFDDLTLREGRALSAGEERAVMLGKTLAQDLKLHAGDTVLMQGEEFEVVGIYESFHHFETGGSIMDLKTLQGLMLREGSVTGFGVLLDDADDPEALAREVSDRINAITEDTTGQRVRLSAKSTAEYVDSFMPLRLARAMTWMVSLLALLSATIFLLTTMIMSVLERVKEIGILRAVGWRKNRVLRLVLGESVTLALIGALIGAAAAYPVTYLLMLAPGIRGYIGEDLPFVVVLEGLGMALVMGLFGGLLPAFRAASLLPTEALRHE